MALDFGCPIFSELRAKNIFLLDSMNSLRKNRNMLNLIIFVFLLQFKMIPSYVFSLAYFVRQAIALRENWFGSACLRGRSVLLLPIGDVI